MLSQQVQCGAASTCRGRGDYSTIESVPGAISRNPKPSIFDSGFELVGLLPLESRGGDRAVFCDDDWERRNTFFKRKRIFDIPMLIAGNQHDTFLQGGGQRLVRTGINQKSELETLAIPFAVHGR